MQKTAHILVIRLSAMGDAAMAVPVLRVLSETYPGIKITVLSRKVFKPLFTDIPGISFYEADTTGKHKGFLGLLRLASGLKDRNITHIADLHNVLRSKVIRKYFSFLGTKSVKIDKGRKEKKALTRAKNKDFKPLKTTVQRYADVFEKLGFPIDLSRHQFPKKKNLPKKLQGFFKTTAKKHIGIAPFAAHKSKTYPPDLMKKVIFDLDASGVYNILLFGSGKEAEILEKTASKYNSAVNLAGKLSFDEELNIISHLDAMLAMDSGNAHLAAIYGIKTITLWGATHPFTGFYPFGQPLKNALLADRNQYPLIPVSVYGNKYPKGYENAIRTIKPEEVVEKIHQVIENR